MTANPNSQAMVVTGEVLPPMAVGVFGTSSPAQIVMRVAEIADALSGFIRERGLAKRLESAAAKRRREEQDLPAPREYVMIEGWALAGTMLGIAPITREVKELRSPSGRAVGFEARVELVRADGAVVGGAVAECSWDEDKWEHRDPFAVKSMAQTRAAGKAFRMTMGFIMAAAGFEATPAEEMTMDDDEGELGAPPRASRGRAGRSAAPPAARSESRPSASGEQAADGDPKNAGELLTWAKDDPRVSLSRAQVCEMLHVKLPSEITDFAAAKRTILEKLGIPPAEVFPEAVVEGELVREPAEVAP